MSWKVKGMTKTWDYGMRFAKIAHRMMKYAEVEVSLYWTWQNNYEIMSADTKVKYPSYFVTRHQVDFLNTGTQIVHSTSSDAEVLVLSGIRPDGSKVLQLINLKKEAVALDISGFDSEKIDVISTTEANNWDILKNASSTTKGKTEIQLKPQSVNTLVFN
jgi:hypothetical protein